MRVIVISFHWPPLAIVGCKLFPPEGVSVISKEEGSHTSAGTKRLPGMKGGSNISLKAVHDSLAFICGISDGLSCSLSAICVL